MVDLYYSLTLSMAATLLTTLLLTPLIMRFMRQKGHLAPDRHKKGVNLPEMGGTAVVGSFFVGFVLLMSLSPDTASGDASLIWALLAGLAAALIGIVDDLMDMKQRFKAIAPLLLAIPLGLSLRSAPIGIPFYGSVDPGWAMVVLIPVAVTCSANAVNMLEGLNGLSSGLSLIITGGLGIIAFLSHRESALILLVPLLASVLGFWSFNRYPSRIFPGDTFTLFTGATLACAALLGRMEFYILLMMIPHITEFFLKFTGRLRRSRRGGWATTPWGTSFGDVRSDGTLSHNGFPESLTHVIMRLGRLSERQVVWVLYGVQTSLAVLAVGLYLIGG